MPNSKPYRARAYKIPHHILEVVRKEVEELCQISVLQADIHSEWGAPCLFRAKNGGFRFLTDLCQLNQSLIQKPVHLLLIDDVLWKVQGFTYATYLDLNRGYYHFELDHQSKLLCGIILPWRRYVYAHLPQGCMPSSYVFQGHMEKYSMTLKCHCLHRQHHLFTKTTIITSSVLPWFLSVFNHKISMIHPYLQGN
jgi:hypothetical protein